MKNFTVREVEVRMQLGGDMLDGDYSGMVRSKGTSITFRGPGLRPVKLPVYDAQVVNGELLLRATVYLSEVDGEVVVSAEEPDPFD